MKFSIFLLLCFWIVLPLRSVSAVPPPDFIIQVVSQISTFFTIGVAILSSLYLSVYQYLKYSFGKYKKYFIIGGLIFIPIFAYIIAIIGDNVYQKSQILKENQEWISETKVNIQKDTNIPLGYQDSNIKASSRGQSNILSGVEIKNQISKKDTETQESDIKKQSVILEELPLSISNSDFKNILTTEKPFILDAREDIEYAMGHIPGSNHIRFADLKNGEWKNLSNNTIIYVLCWSGVRGKEVAEFLQSHGLKARYLEKGVDGWVSFGGLWEGEVKFKKKFSEERYSLVFTTSQIKEKQKNHVVIVDARNPEKFSHTKITNSINIPLLEIPRDKFDDYFSQVSEKSEIITVCDEYINCFAARLVGIELEKRKNVIFLGRYNKPWEY